MKTLSVILFSGALAASACSGSDNDKDPVEQDDDSEDDDSDDDDSDDDADDDSSDDDASDAGGGDPDDDDPDEVEANVEQACKALVVALCGRMTDCGYGLGPELCLDEDACAELLTDSCHERMDAEVEPADAIACAEEIDEASCEDTCDGSATTPEVCEPFESVFDSDSAEATDVASEDQDAPTGPDAGEGFAPGCYDDCVSE